MKDYKILDNYLDEEKIYDGKNYGLYKVYKESNLDELLDDECFLIKIWPRQENENNLIKELWMDEVRQLQVLKNFPNSKEYLLVINNAHYDDESYSIVYDCDENETLLSVYLDKLYDSNSREQRKNLIYKENLIKNKNRIKLWENILNIAHGLAILHQNGLLHRKVSVDNIVIKKEESSYNFRLTGFEWLLSVNTLKSSFRASENDESVIVSSYNDDWQSLGKLIQYLLIRDDSNLEHNLIGQLDFLTSKEKDFLKLLENIYVSNNVYNDKIIISEDLIKDIRSIIFSLKNEFNQSTSDIKSYDITVNNKKIDEMITVISEHLGVSGDISIQEFNDFISKDLDVNKINIIKCLYRNNEKYCLQGNQLYYEIGPSKIRGTVDTMAWNNVAIIRKVFKNLNEWIGYSKQTKDFHIKLNFVSRSESINYWSNLIEQFKQDKGLNEDVKSFINTMLICYAIEVSDYWSKVFKAYIKVELGDANNGDGQIILTMNSEKNLENNKYAKLLNRPLSTLHFKDLISDLDEKEWVLSSKLPINKEDFHASPDIRVAPFVQKDFKVILTYKRYIKKEAKYIFYIKSDSKNPNTLRSLEKYINQKEFYIYPKSLIATFTALTRRNFTLSHVSKNEALISSIMHMETSTTKIKYPNPYIENYKKLDESKMSIYQEILDTYPNYIVQGPPGVGKTFLVTSLLEQIFSDEPTSKVVLSAQSHSTVQVLYDELKKSNLSKDLITLDAFNNAEDEIDDSLDIKLYEKHTEELWNNIKKSEMWKCASKYHDLKDEMIKAMKSMFLRKSLYKHVLSSANIILATSNSGTIETLNRNYNQFDWTILEESGKASGLELLSPLLLSSKRLLIGDHKQLPPFAEKTVNDILIGPNFDVPLLVETVSKGPFFSHLTKVSGLGEFVEASEFVRANINDNSYSEDFIKFFNEVYYPVIRDIEKYFSLFKTLVGNVEKYKESNSKRMMGNIITEQYRMHPDISKIISNLFYNDRLTNNPINEKKYLNLSNRPFRFSNTNQLPELNQDNGFIWLNICDPNYSTETRGLERSYTNKAECEIIKRILETVEVKPINKGIAKPSIMILTPYKNQLYEIKEMVREENLIQTLQSKGFECSGEICKTVDSFQGGEADLVIVSLVRHNISKPSGRALGFLLDERRMNVMLSRAKYQMFVIGSIGMFEYWAYKAPEKRLNINDKHQFVDKLCKWVNGQETGDDEIDYKNVIKKIDITSYISNFFQQ
ncbi:DUF2075 domain-containing protein [Acinetobacter haemolyticus]|nr:DUF2075 domain-containing protein [Acinetobacter haemolyticus]